VKDYGSGILGIASGAGSLTSAILANLGVISAAVGLVGTLFGALVAIVVWQERRMRKQYAERHLKRLEDQEIADVAAGRRISEDSWA
jgi:uncharacterized membrane protein YciS (DUF1049 family)